MCALGLAACVLLYAAHAWNLWRYAIDVPYMDEWASFEPHQLPAGLTIRGILAQHNEHRLSTTRVLVWAQFKLTGWNLRWHQFINLAIYALILGAVVWIVGKSVPDLQRWMILGFTVFLLSPLNWANHLMGYQSQVHFWLLFLLLASYFLFEEPHTMLRLAVGCGAATLSTYSMAGGFASSLTLLVAFAAIEVARSRSLPPVERRPGYWQLAAVTALLGGATLLWLVGYRQPAWHPPLAFPYERKFWGHFLNVVASGFGISQPSAAVGVVCLGVVILPLLVMVSKRATISSSGDWRMLGLTASVLSVLALVSVGRSGFGVEQARASRYYEFGMMLMPLTAANVTIALRGHRRWRAILLGALWILCASSVSGWKDFAMYKEELARREAGIECLKAYYAGQGNADCPTIFPGPIPPRLLEAAKGLNASFYRGISRAERRMAD